MKRTPQLLRSNQEAADFILATFGKDLHLGTPLGLGKPITLLNLIYQRVKSDPTLKLRIYTALSLNPPEAENDLARRFLEPFSERHWGKDYPILQYLRDANRGELPENVELHEFYAQAGSALGSPTQQRHYHSINYTHVPKALLSEHLQVVVQLVAKDSRHGSQRFSLSCNPDITLELAELHRAHNRPLLIVGVVHPNLPFLTGEAEVNVEFFDVIVDDPEITHPLFSLPREPIDETDHAIGFYASQTVVDSGTIQIGIGSLSDAIVASLLCRHQRNDIYQSLVDFAWRGRERPELLSLSSEPFHEGLYGLSEMVMDGFMHLRKAGILKRQVIDRCSGTGTYLHGAFFLGSKEFYSWLGSLQGEEFAGLRMGRVTDVNDLYDPNETLLREQRRHCRFFNTCMQVTLLGGAAAETLDDGRIVSGVGGQYNFVAMSHELENSRSILMLRSTRTHRGVRRSNLVWSHGHLTIPRHLRDIVITEYGIADIKGKSDEETIKALLNITDSDFQEDLIHLAKRHKKLDLTYRLPEWVQHNNPKRVMEFISEGRRQGLFGTFAMGSDFTPEEEKLVKALAFLKSETARPWGKLRSLKLLFQSLQRRSGEQFQEELRRMALEAPRNLRESLYRSLLTAALSKTHPPIAVQPVDDPLRGVSRS